MFSAVQVQDSDGTWRVKIVSQREKLDDRAKGIFLAEYSQHGRIGHAAQAAIYPIRLIELELKAHDERYRDKKELDVKVSGGVLVAPADVSSIDDWEARFGEGKVIEGEAQEGSDD